MRRIKLTGKRGGSTLVDDADFAWLSQYKWNHLKNGYAARYFGPAKNQKMIYMHREIMGFPKCEVDHKDGFKLNNQRHNLRAATRRFNATNSGSRYPRGRWGRNVTKMPNRKKPFIVQCWFNNRPVFGGYYSTAEEAQAAAAHLRRKLKYADC